MALPESLCLFPVYRARAVYEHQTFFSVHTQNRKLVDREEIFSEQKVYWIRLVDYTFNQLIMWSIKCQKTVKNARFVRPIVQNLKIFSLSSHKATFHNLLGLWLLQNKAVSTSKFLRLSHLKTFSFEAKRHKTIQYFTRKAKTGDENLYGKTLFFSSYLFL